MNPHKHITVVSTLTGSAAKADKWFEPHGCLQTVIDSPAPGFVRLILLGGEGLQVRHADRLFVIPKDVLLALAENLDPGFKPPSAADLEAAEANNKALLPVPGEIVPARV